ncbi:MAG: 4-hydroxy-3-methylbut-2-enyl diphosphate reductase [Candidatus Omnitrophica bacterium]|nr:4-hydroxy-3-methylbut-2-enyl diphosphate reductase [Candidatus Omnitrophota bacterium]
MPTVKLAKNIGFCAGVRRAMTIVEKTLEYGKTDSYSFGPVIHNAQVIKDLQARNLTVIHSLKELPSGATLILPSHGTPERILKSAAAKRLNLVDVTCPNVSNLQKICKSLDIDGFDIVIVGDKAHPEVKALAEIAKKGYIIENALDVKKCDFVNKKIGIISQTTQNKDKFFDIVGKILKNNSLMKEVRIFNTICLDTTRRQEEVKRLAKEVDVLLVIGSKFSANTKRLLDIGRKLNKKTFLIENELSPIKRFVNKAGTVGLISGASAPDWLVKKIIKKIKGV